jgi:hypothetical protein
LPVVASVCKLLLTRLPETLLTEELFDRFCSESGAFYPR